MKRFASTFIAMALWTASSLTAAPPATQTAADSPTLAAVLSLDEPRRVQYSGARQELELTPNEPITVTLSTTQPAKLRLSTTQPGQEFNLEFVATPPTPTLWNTHDIVGPDGQLVGIEASPATGKADEAYMGVGVDAPDATLRAQLGLPADSGLVVSYLDDQGPAKSLVELHDILQKFDNQLLVNAEQLVTLVRMHRPGDKVSITLVRQAKSVTVQMELGRRKTLAANGESDGASKAQSKSGSSATGAAAPDAALPLPNGNTSYAMMLDQNRKLPFWNGDSRVETFDDGEILVILSPNGNLQAINAKNGEVLFQGPIRNQQQWDAIPAKVKERVATWREMIQTASPATQPSSPKQ